MPLPNFIIIGPPKCGTTALYATLARHPQIYTSPVKEPRFFAFDGQPPSFVGPGADRFRQRSIADWTKYVELFAAAQDQRALGEASPIYLTNYQPEQTAENIRCRLPDVRLVAVLRQPVDRAYSHFNFYRQAGYEPLADFRQALAEEDRRLAANWMHGFRYGRNGLYFSNLAPYFERFARAQIRIYLYEELCHQPQALLVDLCNFLGVDPALAPPQIERRNVTTWVRSRALQSLLRQRWAIKSLISRPLRRALGARLRVWNQVRPPPLDLALRRELTDSYHDEILRLQDLLGRDLGHWLAAS